jgi:hypothetical protein
VFSRPPLGGESFTFQWSTRLYALCAYRTCSRCAQPLLLLLLALNRCMQTVTAYQLSRPFFLFQVAHSPLSRYITRVDFLADDRDSEEGAIAAAAALRGLPKLSALAMEDQSEICALTDPERMAFYEHKGWDEQRHLVRDAINAALARVDEVQVKVDDPATTAGPVHLLFTEEVQRSLRRLHLRGMGLTSSTVYTPKWRAALEGLTRLDFLAIRDDDYGNTDASWLPTMVLPSLTSLDILLTPNMVAVIRNLDKIAPNLVDLTLSVSNSTELDGAYDPLSLHCLRRLEIVSHRDDFGLISAFISSPLHILSLHHVSQDVFEYHEIISPSIPLPPSLRAIFLSAMTPCRPEPARSLVSSFRHRRIVLNCTWRPNLYLLRTSVELVLAEEGHGIDGDDERRDERFLDKGLSTLATLK